MATMNGNLMLSTKQYILETYSQPKLDEILKKTDETTRNVISGTILSNQMYDVKIYQDFLGAFVKVLGEAELRKSSEHNMKKQLSGFYGILVKFVTIEKLMSQADKFWKRTYSEGSMSVVSNDKNKFKITIDDFEYNEAMMLGFMYYIEAMISLVSKKKVISTVNKIDKKTTEFNFTVLLI